MLMDPFTVVETVKDMIAYDSEPFVRYRSASQVDIDRKAKCFDACNYLQEIIGGIILQFDIVRGDEKWVHNNLLFIHRNRYYIFEWMWCYEYRSVFGPFLREDEMIAKWIEVMSDILKSKYGDGYTITLSSLDLSNKNRLF